MTHVFGFDEITDNEGPLFAEDVFVVDPFFDPFFFDPFVDNSLDPFGFGVMVAPEVVPIEPVSPFFIDPVIVTSAIDDPVIFDPILIDDGGSVLLPPDVPVLVLEGTPLAEVLEGTASADDLYGGGGDDLLYGGPGSDLLFGEEGNDDLFGGRGDDDLWGGLDADILQGNSGDDWLVGGFGADLFLFGPGDGHDVIEDFFPEEGDRIALPPGIGYGVTVDQEGNAVVVVTAMDSIRLLGIAPEQVHPDWFVVG